MGRTLLPYIGPFRRWPHLGDEDALCAPQPLRRAELLLKETYAGGAITQGLQRALPAGRQGRRRHLGTAADGGGLTARRPLQRPRARIRTSNGSARATYHRQHLVRDRLNPVLHIHARRVASSARMVVLHLHASHSLWPPTAPLSNGSGPAPDASPG